MKKRKPNIRMPEPAPGLELNGWKLIKEIGTGGNGVVWRASKSGFPDRAIKILRRIGAKPYARFKAEVQALSMVQNLAGVIPILDSSLPDPASKDLRWFAMPLAGRFDSFISGKEPLEIARQFILLAETLSQLHQMEIFHRDIKPANLLALHQRLCFSDFGLVKFPAREDITPAKEDVGPKFTMAPEMRRDASRAQGGPADVYSFAKTLWIALTGQPFAFDGQYTPASNIGLKRHLRDVYTTTLDELISECTDNDPAARPLIQTVATRLAEWIELVSDFHQRNLKEWVEVQNKLFPAGSPDSVAWTDIDSICSVLRLIAEIPSLNHMFLPDGGGITIEGVSKAGEEGLIVLDHGLHTLLKPAKLNFESFGPGSKWNYFRLEAEEIAPIDPDERGVSTDRLSEYLCELGPGHYVGPEAWDYGEYRGDPLPEGARPVTRYLRGSFVLFSTRSPYNADSATYDARHYRVSAEKFREYIARHAKPRAHPDLDG
jgi:serine/threonine-protein kinase